MSPTATLLYLHGFLSSPQSKKAQVTQQYCQRTQCVEQMVTPELAWGPAAAMAQLRAIMASLEGNVILIGSSLGGYYATYLAAQYSVPAALVNPAVRPFDRWENYLGEHKNFYSDAVHQVTREHIAELKKLDVPDLQNPQDFLLLVETADETLDYRHAVSKYAKCRQIVHEGGNHSYVNYEADLPVIFEFLLSRIA